MLASQQNASSARAAGPQGPWSDSPSLRSTCVMTGVVEMKTDSAFLAVCFGESGHRSFMCETRQALARLLDGDWSGQRWSCVYLEDGFCSSVVRNVTASQLWIWALDCGR
jgi:hypothetical protein